MSLGYEPSHLFVVKYLEVEVLNVNFTVYVGIQC
jgi:hypothetical protein